MITFEYTTYEPELKGFVKKKPDPVAILEDLNKLGAEGWELVAITPIAGNTGSSYGASTAALLYTFKRPLK